MHSNEVHFKKEKNGFRQISVKQKKSIVDSLDLESILESLRVQLQHIVDSLCCKIKCMNATDDVSKECCYPKLRNVAAT